jgi:uncharacterized protein
MSRLLALALVFLLLTASSHAMARDELYQAQVAVVDQSAAEREKAIQAALVQVLTRLTGRPGAQPETAPLVRTASRFVQQFRYDATEELRLIVAFDGPSLQRALGERGVAVWRNDRPPVLVWLALDAGNERLLLGANERPAVREPVARAGRELGLPLLFPLLDLEDLGKVSFADVWGGFSDDLRAASVRYGTELVVRARVYREADGQWQARWALVNQRDAAWQSSDPSLERALAGGLAELARRLAPQYAAVPRQQASSDALRLQVHGVRELSDYLRLESYLAALSGVNGARLEAAQGETATFRLALESSPERVLRSLQSSGRLRPVADAGEPGSTHRFELR